MLRKDEALRRRKINGKIFLVHLSPSVMPTKHEWIDLYLAPMNWWWLAVTTPRASRIIKCFSSESRDSLIRCLHLSRLCLNDLTFTAKKANLSQHRENFATQANSIVAIDVLEIELWRAGAKKNVSIKITWKLIGSVVRLIAMGLMIQELCLIRQLN